jgi:hypothetical protein
LFVDIMPLRPKTKPIALLLGALIAWIYIRYYVKVAPGGFELLQTSIANASIHDVLAEKRPLVLQEPLESVDSLLSTTLRHLKPLSFVDKNARQNNNKNIWRRCIARYTIIAFTDNSVPWHELDIRHPFMPCDVARIRLEPNQVVILPPRYLYRPADFDGASKSMHLAEVYDPLHMLMRPFAALLLTSKSEAKCP